MASQVEEANVDSICVIACDGKVDSCSWILVEDSEYI